MNEVKMREIIGKTGIRLSLYTGRIENGFEDRWSSEYFYRAHNDDYVEFVSEELVDEYEFMVAEYSPDTFTEEEQRKLYLAPIGKDFGRLYYYCDDAINKIRMIFLHSHDYREEDRYGYSDEELQWFKETLNSTPNEYKVLVMSHVPPLAKFHFWSNIIRNDEEMMNALVMFNESRQGKAVLAWVHGHNHCDAICNECGINIVSLGCNKCEWFEDKKPCGTTTFHRKLGTVTEDLWDVMVIEESGKVSFVRFGAGDDKEL